MVVGASVESAAAAGAAGDARMGDGGGNSGSGVGAFAPTPTTPVGAGTRRRRYTEGVAPPGGAVSPAATRARAHEIASQPGSVERDMSLGEMTLAMGQFMAQQRCDHAWFVKATEALDNHAVLIDKAMVSVMKLRGDTQQAVNDAQTVIAQIADHTTTIDGNYREHTKAIKVLAQAAENQHASLDKSLRGQVQTEVKRLEAGIDALHTAATSGTTIVSELKLQQLEIAAARLEEKINTTAMELGKQIESEKDEARTAFRKLQGDMQDTSR